MKFRTKAIAIFAVLVMAICISMFTPVATVAQQVGDQVLLSMKFISGGVQTQGAGVLQVGEVNTPSAAVATATLTEVVAAPASGSIYVRGVFVEKSTGAAGTYTLKYGTGTNCGTGTTTILGPVTNPTIGFNRIEVLVAAGKALCLQTDAATTLVRSLTN